MASRGMICPEKLPPTTRAAYFHGLRAHYQIISWLHMSESSELDPTKWGWINDNSMLVPILTDKDVAPLEVKTLVRCNCQLTSKSPCGSRLCTCRRNGLPCISLCGNCRGEECTNPNVSKHLYVVT